MQSQEQNSKYYTLTKAMSYNSSVIISIGARGIGKTYATLSWCFDRYFRHGEEFVMLRRSFSELQAGTELLNDMALKYNVDFDLNHSTGVIAITHRDGEKLEEPEKCGYMLSLSKSQLYKSRAFPLVKTIMFDEFIIENTRHHHYLEDEVNKLLGLYSTISRDRDGIRLIMLSNAGFINNPYFAYWGVNNAPEQEFTLLKDYDILIEVSKRSGNLGKLSKFARKEFMDYAESNQFKDKDDELVNGCYYLSTKPTFEVYPFKLYIRGDILQCLMDENSKYKYSLIKGQETPFSKEFRDHFKALYEKGVIRFPDHHIHGRFRELVKISDTDLG